MSTHPRRRFHLALWLLPALALSCFALFTTTFALLAAPAQPQSPQALGRISGVVTDQSGQPLAGIEVTLLSDNIPVRAPFATTADGTFHFSALFPGVYGLSATDPTGLYAGQYYTATADPQRATPLVVNGNQLTGVVFRLQVAGAIQGRVTAGGDVPPWGASADNLVLLYLAEGEYLTPLQSAPILSTTGDFVLPTLLPGAYRVCASLYFPFAGNLSACYGAPDLSDATVITVTSGMTQTGIDFDLDQGQFEGMISGTVTLRGAPMAALRVDLQGFEVSPPVSLYTMTNGAGHYRFGGLPAGTYSVRVSDPAKRYPSLWHDGRPAGPGVPNVSSKTPLSLSNGEVLSQVNVSLIEYAVIQGRAFRLDPFLRAGDVITVDVAYQSSEIFQTFTAYPVVDATGRYSLTTLFPGSYVVSFRYCYPYPPDLGPGTICRWRYYDGDPKNPNRIPPPFMLTAGQVLTGIDSLIGPDAKGYLPLILGEAD